jgi:hypothetical protein
VLEIARAQLRRETKVRETRVGQAHPKTQPVLARPKTVRERRTIAMCHSREIARVRQRARTKLRAPALRKPRLDPASPTIATFHSQEIPETTVRAK